MNLSKTRFLLLSVSVLSLGIILGTFFWLKLAPRPGLTGVGLKHLEGLSRYGAVPEFSLVERSGKAITLGNLRGMIWVADFIYTTCTDTCPLQTAEMGKLQEKWNDKPGLKLVSFSVDPEKDTAEVLSRYADRYKADSQRWLFLTGAKEEITRLVQEGFKLSAVPIVNAGSSESVIMHSPRFVLIDRQAQIRGYYDSRDQQALERLKKDIAVLIDG
ncbi:MAG TPA: SCO family protein [Candidatus Binatia bacterium]|jgi:protein SCO1